MNRFLQIALMCIAISYIPTQTVKAEQYLDRVVSQRCEVSEDCTLVAKSCKANCATLPVNKEFADTQVQARNQRCINVNLDELPSCKMNPPINAVCINKRCTIDFAFKNNSHGGDYENGGHQGSSPW